MITYAIACADLLTATELDALRAQAARAEQLEGALLTAENHLRHALAARRADDKHLAILRARDVILAVIPEELMKPTDLQPRAKRDARESYLFVAACCAALAVAVTCLAARAGLVDRDAPLLVMAAIGVICGLALWRRER